MIELWLDMILPWWRQAAAFYQRNAVVITTLLAVWLVVVWVGQRTADKARRAVRERVIELGAAASTLGAGQLAKDLAVGVHEVAARHRWMPAAGGFWVRRCEPAALARYLGVTPERVTSVRNGILRTLPRRRRGD